jgi:pimeloyl-ACP methyl ester carboxylesterase
MWDKLLHKYLRAPYILNAEELQAPTQQTATIILLHGIGSSLSMWKPLVKKMPADVRIIAIDLLGFGASPKPNWNTYNVRTQADSLATTLFSMKIRGPVVVVGHSLGSLVAIEFARRYPLMTKSLVLVSPPLYNPDRIRKRRDFNPDDVLKRMYAIFASKPDAAGKILKLASRYYLANKGIVGATIDPLTAPFVAETFQRYNDGQTMREIRDWLNEKGVKNQRGGLMTFNTIQHMITSY